MLSMMILSALFSTDSPTQEVLRLEDVLSSVQTHVPDVKAAEYRRDQAEALATSARGIYDLKLKAQASRDATGAWKKQSVGVGAEQLLPIWGLKVSGGYEYGDNYPIYYGDKVTSENGRVKFGASLPILRGGLIDEQRLLLVQRNLGVDIQTNKRRQKVMAAYFKASDLYAKWVAKSLKVSVDARNLSLAEQRSKYIHERIGRGDAAALQGSDATSIVLERSALLTRSILEVQNAAVELSYYLRSEDGRRHEAPQEQAPAHFEKVKVPEDEQVALEKAMSIRPEIEIIRAKIKQKRAAAGLYSLSQLPQLDLDVSLKQNLGDKAYYGPLSDFTTKDKFQSFFTLKFSFPVQRRKASGAKRAAEAEILALEQDLQGIEDRLEILVRQAIFSVRAARKNLVALKEAYEMAKLVEEGARTRWELGDVSLLDVNLREEKTAKLAKQQIEAEKMLFSAEVWLAIIVGNFFDYNS